METNLFLPFALYKLKMMLHLLSSQFWISPLDRLVDLLMLLDKDSVFSRPPGEITDLEHGEEYLFDGGHHMDHQGIMGGFRNGNVEIDIRFP